MDMRNQLASHKLSITFFLSSLGATRLRRIEKHLDEFIREIKSEKELRIMLLEDQQYDVSSFQWSELRRYLQLHGLSQCDLDAHPHGIRAYLQELFENSEAASAGSNQDTYKLGSAISSSPRSRKIEVNVPAEIRTEVQEYDKKGRLRELTATRQNSRSTLRSDGSGTTTTNVSRSSVNGWPSGIFSQDGNSSISSEPSSMWSQRALSKASLSTLPSGRHCSVSSVSSHSANHYPRPFNPETIYGDSFETPNSSQLSVNTQACFNCRSRDLRCMSKPCGNCTALAEQCVFPDINCETQPSPNAMPNTPAVPSLASSSRYSVPSLLANNSLSNTSSLQAHQTTPSDEGKEIVPLLTDSTAAEEEPEAYKAALRSRAVNRHHRRMQSQLTNDLGKELRDVKIDRDGFREERDYYRSLVLDCKHCSSIMSSHHLDGL
ncbi:hypothetical protein MMC10_001371 [Thelotrema lepadinum]|nr:hypothetical protein [Thelotrema lepadinum]